MELTNLKGEIVMRKDNFTLSTPAQCGVAYENINAFIDEIEKRHIMLHGFAFLRGDKLFAEGYFAPVHKDFLHRMYSVSKSFVSIAVGFCQQDGLLSLDDPLEKYFSEYLDGKSSE